MKAHILFAYFIFQIIYLIHTDGGRAWCGFNLASHMLLIAYLCHLVQGIKSLSEKDKLIFTFAKYALFANSVYTIVCVFMDSYWAIYQTDIFAYIIGISLVVLLVHIAVNKDKFK